MPTILIKNILYIMQILLRCTFLILVLSGFSGCSKSTNSNSNAVSSDTETGTAPVIGELLTDIRHHIPNYVGAPTIKFTVSVDITDPDGSTEQKGSKDLDYIYVEQMAEGRTWTLLDPESYGENRRDCRTGLDSNVFECTFWTADKLHSISLHNWRIIAADKSGNKTSKQFQLLLPDGQIAEPYQKVHSTSFTGDKTLAVPALEALRVADNNMTFTSNNISRSYHFEFTATDARIKNYGIDLYASDDSGSQRKFAAWIEPKSSSIVSTPIVATLNTILDIPWSEIDFQNGTAPEGVIAAQIVVFDEVPKSDEEEPSGRYKDWVNYVGVSEFILLK